MIRRLNAAIKSVLRWSSSPRGLTNADDSQTGTFLDFAQTPGLFAYAL